MHLRLDRHRINQFTRGFGAGFPPGPARHIHPRAYDDYFKAYSVAMLPGKQRDNVSYGGKSTWTAVICAIALANLISSYYATVCVSQSHFS
jgi:ubiquitin fusion degradation protein 1